MYYKVSSSCSLTHMILADLDNWLRELELWCPALKVLLYYGSQEALRTIRNEILDGVADEFHVLLTTLVYFVLNSRPSSLFLIFVIILIFYIWLKFSLMKKKSKSVYFHW